MKRIGCALVLAAAMAAPCRAQQLPDAPTRSDKVILTMAGVYTAERVMDAVSTHVLLSDSCKCFHEADPVAPHSKRLAPQLAFHLGIAAAVGYGALILNRSHPKMAKLLLSLDMGSEAVAAGHNMAIRR